MKNILSEKQQIRLMRKNWQREENAAFFYKVIASRERDTIKKKIYKNLAHIEREHARMWRDELKRYAVTATMRPGVWVYMVTAVMHILGSSMLVDLFERLERSSVRTYFNQIELFEDEQTRALLTTIIPVEKGHSTMLLQLNGKSISPLDGERWHTGGSSIRNIIFGMNDGLLSVFSLVAGVAGGAVENDIIVLAGLAGTVAGAISMTAGAYVATKAEREVMEKHLMLEKKELELMPETETRELALAYQLKGIESELAEVLAHKIMSNKEIALETMAREELGFAPSELSSPFHAGCTAGMSFIVGSAVPVVPFLILGEEHAFNVAIILSLGGFFIIGAGRTIFTEKNPVISGLEMFFIGTTAAVITYWIGIWISTAI